MLNQRNYDHLYIPKKINRYVNRFATVVAFWKSTKVNLQVLYVFLTLSPLKPSYNGFATDFFQKIAVHAVGAMHTL